MGGVGFVPHDVGVYEPGAQGDHVTCCLALAGAYASRQTNDQHTFPELLPGDDPRTSSESVRLFASATLVRFQLQTDSKAQ